MSPAWDSHPARHAVADDGGWPILIWPAVLHGGAIMAFADTLGALGTLANLTERDRTATIDSKTNFIRGAPVGSHIIGETTPLHRGQRTMVWQTRVTTPDNKLVAVVTRTQLVYRSSRA